MIEAVYNAAGLGLPIVMTLANRAIGAPINIWNDHSDAMAVRDAGWIQLFAETNQEAADLHVQAFRLAEELSLPVMVCMDGFILTHAVERVDVPDQAAGRRLPAALRAAPGARSRTTRSRSARWSAPRPSRRSATSPTSASSTRSNASPRSRPSSPRPSGATAAACVHTYRTEDAEMIVVALGSVLGTIKDAVDARRDAGHRVGVVGITSFRPFPIDAVRAALAGARTGRRRREGLQRRLRRGALDRRRHGDPRAADCPLRTVVAGLGGRAITTALARGDASPTRHGRSPEAR